MHKNTMSILKYSLNAAIAVSLALVAPVASAHDYYNGGKNDNIIRYTSWTCQDKCLPGNCPSQCIGELKVELTAKTEKTSTVSGSRNSTFKADASIGFGAPGWLKITDAKVGGGWTGGWNTAWEKKTTFGQETKITRNYTNKECVRFAHREKYEFDDAQESIMATTSTTNCKWTWTGGIYGFCGPVAHTAHNRNMLEYLNWDIESGDKSCKWSACNVKKPDTKTTTNYPAAAGAGGDPYGCAAKGYWSCK